MRQAGFKLVVVGGVGSIVLAACGGSSSSSSSSSQPISVGVVAPISGSLADAGTDIVNAAQLAASQANASGGVLGRQIQIVPEDDQCDAQVGVQAAQRLLTENITAIVGGYCSGSAIPESDILHRNGDLPFIGASPSNVTFTDRGYDNTYRMIGRDDWEGPATAAYMKSVLKATKVAIIDDNSDFSVGLAKAAGAAFTSNGGQVVFTDAISTGQNDYTAELAKVATFNPDVFYYTGLYPEFAIIAKDYAALSPTYKLLGGGSDIDPGVVKVAGNSLENPNISWVTSAFTKFDAGASAFTKAYEAKFGRTPGDVAVFEYDGMKALIAALKAAGSTSASAVNAALHKISFSGLTGTVSFDSKGDRSAYRYLGAQYKAGNFVAVANSAGSGSSWTWTAT